MTDRPDLDKLEALAKAATGSTYNVSLNLAAEVAAPDVSALEQRIAELDGRRREGRQLLRRLVKYVREDRAVTPGVTRLARLTDQVDDYLQRTHDPSDILRSDEPSAAEYDCRTLSTRKAVDALNPEHALPGERPSSHYSPMAVAFARAEGQLRVTPTGLGFIRGLAPDALPPAEAEVAAPTGEQLDSVTLNKARGALVFCRENFWRDGAEGESVHLLCDVLEKLLPAPPKGTP